MSDATYHVLLTMQAYDETSFKTHKFLPICTYADECNKFIDNGPSLVQDKIGNSYYVSFSPIGFYAPYFFCKIFNLPLDIKSIYIFNSCIMTICAILIMVLIQNIFDNHFLSFIAFILYLSIPEVMLTQGIVYWHHSLSQLFFLLQSIAFYNLMQKNWLENKKTLAIFLLSSFLYSYCEWTGFISTIGFAIAIVLSSFYREGQKIKYEHSGTTKAVLLIFLMIFSGFYIISRFSPIANVNEFLSIVFSRANARSNASLKILLLGYYNSYKPILFVLILICIFSLFYFLLKQRKLRFPEKRKILMLFVLIFPLFENLIMKGHAITYTFDRLKFALPVIFIICYLLSKYKILLNKIVFKLAMSLLLISTFCFSLRNYRKGNVITFSSMGDASFLKDYICNEFPVQKTMFVKEGWRAWGFLQTFYHRNFYCTDIYPKNKLMELAESKNYDYIVYLSASEGFWDTACYTNATLYNTRTMECYIIESDKGNIKFSAKPITVASLSDENWTNGILNYGNVLLFNFDKSILQQIKKAKILSCNGIESRILSFDYDDNWIRVTVDKDANDCQFPNEIKFVEEP